MKIPNTIHDNGSCSPITVLSVEIHYSVYSLDTEQSTYLGFCVQGDAKVAEMSLNRPIEELSISPVTKISYRVKTCKIRNVSRILS